MKLRGVFTCCVGISYGIGPLIAFIIFNYTGNVDTRWAYRAVSYAQWGFAAVAAIFAPFLPEYVTDCLSTFKMTVVKLTSPHRSPWWLVSKRKREKALKSLRKLGDSVEGAQKKLALIELALEEIRHETEGVTYFECFRKSNLRRTMVSVAPLTIQALSGIAFVAGYLKV